MFVNCYDGYDFCLFSVRIKEGVKAELVGEFISRINDLIFFWRVDSMPEGAVVRY
jgi:hypothetical protein